MLQNQASTNFGLHGHLEDVIPVRNKWFGMKTTNEWLLSLFFVNLQSIEWQDHWTPWQNQKEWGFDHASKANRLEWEDKKQREGDS